ncbi:hypothetical protein RRG08_007176 [Elysia crispata]|uniref:Uncharacterized protein n=1 Tax=Elysia crispata TaxID=231223 RepID=A0AAE1B361_9GAST|nr:hypothetical protein RRG08_007176 [Elysia crispata]
MPSARRSNNEATRINWATESRCCPNLGSIRRQVYLAQNARSRSSGALGLDLSSTPLARSAAATGSNSGATGHGAWLSLEAG